MRIKKNTEQLPGGKMVPPPITGAASGTAGIVLATSGNETQADPAVKGGSGKILVVADDFTGANDTGVQFAKYDLKSIVITRKELINKSLINCDVLVVDTESRFDTPEVAYRKAYETGKAFRSKNINCIYKKLDSTFRGNIGSEISGLMDSLEIPHSVIVPAFPSNKRITRNGMVYVDGELLADTEFAKDPRTPVKQSFIPEIIGIQTKKSIALIEYHELKKGKQNLYDKLKQHLKNGSEMIVIDALEDSDLDIIASVTTQAGTKILFCGSTGFAEHLPKYLEIKRQNRISVVVAGSVSETTRKQIEYASKKMNLSILDIDAGKILGKELLSETERIMKRAIESGNSGQDLIIRSASSQDYVSWSVSKGREYGLSPVETSEKIALFLGNIAGRIIKSIRLNGLLLTGGDTAIKTMQSIQSTGTLILDEIEPGIPYGVFLEKKYNNILIVTKAGGFGGEDAILKVLNFLKTRKKQ